MSESAVPHPLLVAVPCPHCGYDLRGNPNSTLCSECGCEVRKAQSAIERSCADTVLTLKDIATMFGLAITSFGFGVFSMIGPWFSVSHGLMGLGFVLYLASIIVLLYVLALALPDLLNPNRRRHLVAHRFPWWLGVNLALALLPFIVLGIVGYWLPGLSK